MNHHKTTINSPLNHHEAFTRGSLSAILVILQLLGIGLFRQLLMTLSEDHDLRVLKKAAKVKRLLSLMAVLW